MKLYGNLMGTNSRRVTIYLAEKDIDIERVDIDMASGEHKALAFLAKNPAGKIPVLELDDGSYLPESAAIVEYLEEIHPQPTMTGDTPETRAKIRALERIGNDLLVLSNVMFQHSHPYFATRLEQIPAVAEALRPKVDEQLAALETHIGDQPFLASDRPTIADCTLFALFQTCRLRLKFPFGADYPRLDAWYARFERRPSAAY